MFLINLNNMQPPNQRQRLDNFTPSAAAVAFLGAPAPVTQASPSADREMSSAKRALDQLSEDTNRDIERKNLNRLIAQAIRPMQSAFSEADFEQRFKPLWQFLNQSHPYRKNELITQLYQLSLSSNPIAPFLASAFGSQRYDNAPEVLAAEFRGLIKHQLHHPAFYTLIFKTWEQNIGNPHLLELLNEMALHKCHHSIPECLTPLVLAIAKGEFEPAFAPKTPSENNANYIDWLMSIPLTACLGLRVLQKTTEPLTFTRSILYLKCLGLLFLETHQKHIPLRNKIIVFLLPYCSQFVLDWATNKIPAQDPIHKEIIQNFPTKDLIKLLKHFSSEEVLERIEALGPHLNTLEDWDCELGEVILPAAFSVHKQSLRSVQEHPYHDWLTACGKDVHLWVFDKLCHFIEFPEYWPLFNFTESHCDSSTRLTFLFMTALFWPDLCFIQEQKRRTNKDPFLLIEEEEPGLLSQLLGNHHFPERETFPVLEAELPLDAIGFLARYYSLSTPAYRQRFREELPICLAHVLPLIGTPFHWTAAAGEPPSFTRNNHVFLALLQLRIILKIAEFDKSLPDNIIESFKQLIATTCTHINNDYREAFVLVGLIDKLKTILPVFFTANEIDLSPVEAMRVKVNEAVHPVKRIG